MIRYGSLTVRSQSWH
uniref:Uncharacterized protein n=1 Tax=Anguilla anguilla TaxID=7936 RepID=A0A0E9U2T9_ANGAN